MDYEGIEKVLLAIVNSGASIEPAPATQLDPFGFLSIATPPSTIRVDESLKRELRTLLERDAHELRLDATWLRTGDGAGHRVSFNLQAWVDTLMRTALRETPVNAVAKLRNFINANSAPCHVIWLLTGIEPKRSIRVTPEIELVPYAMLPESNSRRLFQSHIDRVLTTIGYSLVPTAGLVLTYELAPVVGEYEGNPRLSEESRSRAEKLGICRLALTCVGPSCPIVLATWSEIDLSMPGAGSGASHARPMGEFAFGPQRVGRFDEGEAVAACQGLLSARQMYRRLQTPLERLGLALRRANSVDRAIELGIALEALLAGDRSGHDPIAHLLRLRAARLLGGTASERHHTYQVIKLAYELRSKAVHTGVVPDDVILDKTGIKTNDFLWQVAQVISRIARKFIAAGQQPDWIALELDPN